MRSYFYLLDMMAFEYLPRFFSVSFPSGSNYSQPLVFPGLLFVDGFIIAAMPRPEH
jgi:hypothetical protein